MKKIREVVKCVIDIGNSKIKVLVAKLYDNGNRVRVLAYGESPTVGLKKSMIENPEALTNSIMYAVNQVEKKLDMKIERVTIGISSPNIVSRTINKKIVFNEHTITEKDIQELFTEAEKDILRKKEKVIKKEMYNIRINNSGIVKNPKGFTAKELQADIHLICLDEFEISSYEEIVNRAGLYIEDITLNSYGSAESVLDDEEKSMGVTLIDIGDGITDILMFKNDKLIYSKSIPLGGVHYINDIAYILEIPKEEAFGILKKLKDKNITDEKIVTESNKTFTVKYIRNIIDARTEDIVKFIVQTIEESGFNGYLGKGIVITGGAVVLDELIKKISTETGYKVIKKLPIPLKGLEESDSSMSSVVGIVIETMKKEFKKMRDQMKEEEKENKKHISETQKNDKKIEPVIDKVPEIIEDKELKELGIIEEDAQEEEKPKNKVVEKIKEWISNYI